ncbi:unnamed protein product [Triticum aestivum]|uniref:Uncharacterized protein n=1 Tax=Triticum aestivum TaxID=4565 RepID=A0A7H4LPC6_WHEAT|nr:unnamed protein product [Triticum aestivum]
MLPLVRRRLLAARFSTLPEAAPPTPLDAAAVQETLTLYTNDWRRALDFFHWSASPGGGNLRPTPSTLSRAVDILGKHFEFPQATALLLAHHDPSDPAFLRPALRALLNRLAAANLVDDAVRAFESTAASVGLRDEASFHLLVDALCDHRRVDEAHHLCLGGRAAAPPPFPPGTKTHNLLLRGWAKARAWARLRQHWLDMDARGVAKDLHSYSIYMDALAKSGKPWKAVKLFKEMKQKRLPVDIVAYNTAIHAVGLAEGVDFAVRMYRQMVEAGCRPNTATFNTIVKLLCKEGRFKEGYAFVQQMHKAGCEPNELTYHCFFQYLSRPQEVLALFEKMLQRGCRPRMDTYVMLIKRFGRWGFLRPVFFVWKTMEEQGLTPDAFAYNTLIDALLEKGMVDLARKYDEEMLAKGLSPKPRKELGTKMPGSESDSDNNALSGVI